MILFIQNIICDHFVPNGNLLSVLQKAQLAILFRATSPRTGQASEATFFCDTPLVRSVFGLQQAIFTERSGGVAAIVCDTAGNTRQGYCYTCLAIGEVCRSGH